MWGGRKLEATFKRELPPGNNPIGESWEIVDESGNVFKCLDVQVLELSHDILAFLVRYYFEWKVKF